MSASICDAKEVRALNRDYTDYEVKMLVRAISNLDSLNRRPSAVFEKNLASSGTICIGEDRGDRLFLLNSLIEQAVAGQEAVVPKPTSLSDDVMVAIEVLHSITADIPQTYGIRFPDFPGLEIPCSNVFEAKFLLGQMPCDADLFYRDEVVFSHRPETSGEV